MQAASDALKQYDELSGDRRGSEVRVLHNRIDEAAKSLTTTTPETLNKKISEWWNQCLKWLRK